ncbi:MAG: AI-2E family transporter [Gammaproteobacteria bacterium]
MPALPVYPNWLKAFAVLASLAIVLGLLNWAQAVLIPIALAILLTFLLSPIVTLLHRRGLGRAPGVVLVVILAFSLLGGIGWLVARQVTSLVDTFPQYRQNITQKITAWNTSGKGGFVEKAGKIAAEIASEIKSSAPRTQVDTGTKQPVPVKIIEEDSPLNPSQLWPVLSPILEPFATVGLAVVLVIFMLIKREDLRDRVISLVGDRRLTVTTKALDEAAERISRYLLFQLLINGSYGLVVGIGLFIIGIPYALLWGFFAAVFRYIPYLGPWLAALLPIGVSLIVTESWTAPFMIIGLFLSLELLTNMVVEPWLYGRGIGVSETATLIMIAFWTWLWGPIGLILATPLTVCLVVLGKYVPFLAVFDTLLGNKPALEPHISFYQRLLARDLDEATDIAEEHLKTNSLEVTYDGLIIPSLIYVKRDLENQSVSDDDQQFIIDSTREIVEQVSTLQEAHDKKAANTSGSDEPAIVQRKIPILGCPARDERDEAALLMFKELLDVQHCEVTLTTAASMASEVVALVAELKPAIVCIAAVPPGGVSHTRLLCLRLRARYPELKILVGRWGLVEGMEKNREQLTLAGADHVGTSLQETRLQVSTLVQMLEYREPDSATAA